MPPAGASTGRPAWSASCKVGASSGSTEMTRGRGVILQRHRAGALADAKVFSSAEGLSWRQGENRTRTEFDLTPWRGARGAAGRAVPQGFPRSNRFG